MNKAFDLRVRNSSKSLWIGARKTLSRASIMPAGELRESGEMRDGELQ